MPDEPARIFISYSRKDGVAFATDLRERLLANNLSVWQDLIAILGGHDFWSQIENALRSKELQHFVLVLTPDALASDWVRREIRLARQEGKTVSGVRGPGLDNLSGLPRWIGHVYDLAIPEQRNLFLHVLQRPSARQRVVMMAPEPPADFVKRPVEFGALKRQLLDAKGDSVAITAALRGAGGYGKTTLAKALAHNEDIQDAYFDGILWVELGESPGNLLSLVSDLIEILSGERPGLENVTAAAAKLGEALGDRRILMIVDDAWREQDLRPFLQGGPNTTRLITTRLDNILPTEAVRQPVDAMRDAEALALLAAGLPETQPGTQEAGLRRLAARLGEWPLLLKLVNGFLRDRVAKRQALANAIAAVDQRLDEKGLTAFDAKNEEERNKAVARTIGVSLDLLDETKRACFAELAVFPEDTDIPIDTVGRLWAETGGLGSVDTEDVLFELHNLSLLLSLDLDQRSVRLHDVVRHFLRDPLGGQELIALHQCLVGVIDDSVDRAPEETDRSTQHYRYRFLPHHLAEAGDRERLDSLLLDPGWLQDKLAATGNPQTLVADYEQYGTGETQGLIGRTLRLTAGICTRDPRQLMPQLLGRLIDCGTAGMPEFLATARQRLPTPAILPGTVSLTPPGAETARLEGHSAPVTALCQLADGRLASGSDDNTIRLWDVKTGAETARLEGHSNSVNVLCQLADGRLASGSDDNTIRLWNPKTGTETARLEGHSGAVTALCRLVDGRLASGSRDDTIRLWDVTTGAETTRLEGHFSWIIALCQLADGRLASGSYDTTIRLWDVKTGAETIRLEGHSYLVTALYLLADGRLASGSVDGSIWLWDVKTGAEIGRLEGHPYQVTSLCQLADGRLASGSEDSTIRLWNVNSGADTARFEGHSEGVTTLCQLADGWLASGSYDETIRLWDITTGAETAKLEGRSKSSITALCQLADRRLASGSTDHTIRLWDVKMGNETARLEGHSGVVTALCQLADGRLASAGSWDNTIRLSDVMTGAEIRRLEGQSEWFRALCELTDGRLASGSADTTIQLWEMSTGTETARFEGHSDQVTALCQLGDGRLVSGSLDDTIRLWDVKMGTETARLEGHSDRVTALCPLVDGRLASGSADNTIRLWDVTTGCEVARLEVDAPVNCLVALRDGRLVAGDWLGRLHWLDIID